MEHIVQFSVSFDDQAIIQKVVEQATRQVVEQMVDECRRELRLTGSYCRRSDFVERVVEPIIRDCKSQIVESAAKELADRAPRQKWYRDAMSERFLERERGE